MKMQRPYGLKMKNQRMVLIEAYSSRRYFEAKKLQTLISRLNYENFAPVSCVATFSSNRSDFLNGFEPR